MAKNKDLSIIILSYNTRKLLRDCLKSLEKVKDEANFEVVVVDNASTDGSCEMVRKEFPNVKLVENSQNLGFAAGNNSARPHIEGENVLFLNSDTKVKRGVLKDTLSFFSKEEKIGALACRLELPTGEIDRDSRRSFPTPWVAFTHLVLRLDRLFPKSSLFSRYWYGHKPEDKVHEVDVIQGAFFLTKRELLESLDWFDEDYFLDGEDIDLCWRIKEKGLKIVYYPKVSILHYKGASKGKDEKGKDIPQKEKMKYRAAGVDSMEIFYKKRLWKRYPLLVNLLVLLGIKLVKAARLLKLYAS